MSKTATAALIRINALKKCAPSLLLLALLAGCSTGTADLRATNDGQLATCDSGPHCVSSRATDPDRRVAPFPYNGTQAAALLHLDKAINGMAGAKIVEQRPDYVHATFTSAVFGFVDDVEFILPASGHEIAVSSSSRVGYYDFGVNRSRVETLRKRFETPDS